MFVLPPKQIWFLTISNENIFFTTQGTRFGGIVAPSKNPQYTPGNETVTRLKAKFKHCKRKTLFHRQKSNNLGGKG